LAHDFDIFLGAMNLFTINTIFIALATFIVLKVLRFPMLKYANSKKRKRIAQLASLIAILVMIWPTIAFLHFIEVKGLENDYNNFVKSEVESNNELWLQKDIPNYEEKTIALYFNGEIPNATIADLNNEIKKYEKIKDFKLDIKGNKNRSFDKISEAYDRAIKSLDEKDNIILGLQTEITNLREELKSINESKNTISFSNLSKDAKIRFNDLQSFGYSKMLASKDFISVDTIDVATVKWNAGISDSIARIKETELVNWLKIQVKTDSIILKRD